MHYGVDLGGRRIAVVCIDTMHFAELRLKRLNRAERDTEIHTALQEIGNWVEDTIPPDATLWIEDALRGRTNTSPRTGMRIAMTIGAVMDAHRGPAYLVAPSRWKARVLGYGIADKPEIARWLAYTCPEVAAACGESEDLRDAACLSLGGPTLAPDD